MHAHLLALLDFEQALRAALEARDGEKVMVLVEERIRNLSRDGKVGDIDERRALAEILSRNLVLGQEVLSMIRADLADVQRQRNFMGAPQSAPKPASCSFTA